MGNLLPCLSSVVVMVGYGHIMFTQLAPPITCQNTPPLYLRRSRYANACPGLVTPKSTKIKKLQTRGPYIMLVLLQATLPWTSLVITASKPRRKAYGKTTCSMSIDARSNKQLCKVNSLGGGRPCDRKRVNFGRPGAGDGCSIEDKKWSLVTTGLCIFSVLLGRLGCVQKYIVYGSYTRMASIQK